MIEALERHGVVPGPDTPPAQIREYLNLLYRYEIRRLKARLLAGEFPRSDYIPRVLDLRGRYMLLSMPMQEWTAAGGRMRNDE